MGGAILSSQYVADCRHSILECESVQGAFDFISNIFEENGFSELRYSYGIVKSAPGRKNNLKLEKIVTTHSSLSQQRFDFFTGEYNKQRLFDVDPALMPFHHGNTKPYVSGLAYTEAGVVEKDFKSDKFIKMKADALGSAHLDFPVMTPFTNRLPTGSLTATSDLTGLKLQNATRQAMKIMPHLIDMFIEKAAPCTTQNIIQNLALSPREKECLQYIAMGYRTIDIADKLGRSKSMVDQHVINARNKLHARTLHEAVARALSFKIIEV